MNSRGVRSVTSSKSRAPVSRSEVMAVTAWNLAQTAGSQYFYKRGWAALERQDYVAARREFDRALVFGDGSEAGGDALFFRANTFMRAGEPAAAKKAYEEVVARRPDSDWVAESRYQIGICLEQLGQGAEATVTFRKVVADHPGTPWARMAADRLRAAAAQPAP